MHYLQLSIGWFLSWEKNCCDVSTCNCSKLNCFLLPPKVEKLKFWKQRSATFLFIAKTLWSSRTKPTRFILQLYKCIIERNNCSENWWWQYNCSKSQVHVKSATLITNLLNHTSYPIIIFSLILRKSYGRAQNVINLLNCSKKFQSINAETPSGYIGIIS